MRRDGAEDARDDPVAGTQAADADADRADPAGALTAEQGRPAAGVGVGAHRLHHVDEVESGGGHLDLDLARLGRAPAQRPVFQAVPEAGPGGGETKRLRRGVPHDRRGVAVVGLVRVVAADETAYQAALSAQDNLVLAVAGDQFAGARCRPVGIRRGDVDHQRRELRVLAAKDAGKAPEQRGARVRSVGGVHRLGVGGDDDESGRGRLFQARRDDCGERGQRVALRADTGGGAGRDEHDTGE